MKSLMLLWRMVADDLATRCCTSTTMDCKTVQWRVKHEGMSFLTISLPNFGKDFERSLDQGYVDSSLFLGFSRKACLPRFLGGFMCLVFDSESGRLLDDPSIDAILAIRQLTLMFGKISLPCSDARTRKAIDGYVKCEQDVRSSDRERSPQLVADFGRISDLLFSASFRWMDRKVYQGEVIPKHGPGATADRLRGNGKYRQTQWTSRLEEIFPAGEFLLPSWSYYDQLARVDILEPEAEIPAKVITVPKTLKTPRVIAMEPTAMQYAQQGILELMLEGLFQHGPRNRESILYQLIGIDDQVPNQELAHRGSLKGDLATLDLSEASDRVSNQLVREMMRHFPHLHAAVDASRSRKADVPGHGVIRLAKFASMGSALCFPVEAMVFLTIIFVAVERDLNRPLTWKDVESYLGRVRVYGDDIIVPVEHVRSVVSYLELFGAKVNGSKSFWNGKFRESCGREYYDGEDVSIVRVREVFPTQPRHAAGVISLVSLRNQLYYSGYWGTVKWLDDEIRRVIKHFPTVLPSSPVLGRHSFLGFETQKIGQRLHNPLVKGYVVRAPLPSDKLDGEGALLKFFLKRGTLPNADEEHLMRAGRPVVVDIKLRMASAV